MEELKKENEELKNKLQELEERLKKYTNGDNHKRYYEKNKDKIKEQGTTYLKKLKEENPEKLKEYRRTYYLKKKEKMKQQDDNINYKEPMIEKPTFPYKRKNHFCEWINTNINKKYCLNIYVTAR